MANRLIAGINCREESLGFELLSEFAESKLFLTAEHTRKYFREEVYYPSDVIDRGTHGEWEKKGSLSAAERAHAKVRAILEKPELNIPDAAIVKELETIMTIDAKKHGLDKLPDWQCMLPVA